MINNIIRYFKTHGIGIGLTFASIFVVSLAHWLGAFGILELKSYDYRFHSVRGPLTGWRATDSTITKLGTDIVLVEVDDEAWRLMPETWPYPRGTIWAKVIRNLSLAGAKVIAFDIQFDAPETKSEFLHEFAKQIESEEMQALLPAHGDQILGDAIAEAKVNGTTVIISTKLVKEPTSVPPEYIAGPVEDIMRGNPDTGLINDIIDGDSFSRRYAIYGQMGHEPDKYYLTLGMKATKSFLGISDTALTYFDEDELLCTYGPLRIKTHGYGNTFLVNFYGPPSGYKIASETNLPAWGTFPRYSLAYIIDTEDVELRDPTEDIDWMDQFLPGKIPDWITAIEDPDERQEMIELMGIGEEFDVTRTPFYNKIVIIGVAVEVIHDTKFTPYYNYSGIQQLTPGMETHANAIQTILHGNYINVLGGRIADLFYDYPWSHTVLIALLSTIIYLLLTYVNPIVAFILMIIEGFIYWEIVAGLFTNDLLWDVKRRLASLLSDQFVHNHADWFDVTLPGVGESWVIPVIAPVVGIIVTYSSNMIYRFLNEQKDKKFLKNTFGAYISPDLIDQMYEEKQEPKLGGDSGIKTAYFTDIQSFSGFSEILSATQLVELLNEYLTAMTDVLLEQAGTLDKYEGDAIVAFFGAPIPMDDHAYRACVVALNMQRELAQLREKWAQEEEKWPELVHYMRMRIGINTGDIVTGNMGSRTRMNYTMMGDVVNTAARLEASAKQYGIYIQMTKATLDIAGPEKLEVREIDRVRVVGKKEAVESFELMGFKGDLNSQQTEMRDLYNDSLILYRNQEWDKAKQRFAESEALEEVFEKRPSNPSRVYIERCDFFKENPPGDDWDGVWTLTVK